MATRLSAVDAISPAFQLTKRQMFQPFRFGRWARLAVVSLLTGEFASGGWSGANTFNIPQGGGKPRDELSLLTEPVGERLMEYLPWLLAGVLALMCLWLVLIYIESVYRFLLFDAVLRGRYELGQGWRRWKEAGGSYFLWQIALDSVLMAVLAVLVGVPLLLAWRAGLFQKPEQNIGTLLGLGMLVFFAAGLVALAGVLVAFLARDFVVPVMAMENVRVLEGWRRLLPMLGVEKGAYAGYLLMKIVLAVGTSILFGIVNVAIILILLIPLGAGGTALVLLGKAGGLEWNVYTIGAAAVLGVAALTAVFYAVAFVYAPGMVFFQAYTLQFLGSRYAPLEAALAQASGPPPGPAAGPPVSPAPSPSAP